MIDKEDLKELLQHYVFYQVTCLDCDYWNNKDDKCNKYNSKPPASVIVKTCPEFTCDVPF